ncbi:molecular chaperone HtpG [Fuerstiella marisgermanici]|uniref:Chaperone protein HtpG n=1 Tax=Fuerstiella marisgermanici TaxID=1891926 RepID=A0A1P8WGI4_9PLAN|nr:molecular chaperone HtpG [Fuerstiella marisgermanici]APZ93178.1 High temperature protein G [Fuerstiella marisgermanici]
MTVETPQEKFTFQAEISRLLHILSESLYQNREITVRELVSNASDALDKLRHAALTDTDIDASDLLISIEPNKDEHQLVIRDNGIGMTRDELVQNLGTIAHSGSLEFIEKLQKSDTKDDVSLIGQFGVGFYSAFMLAERVEVRTRSYSEEQGWVWESTGDGSFTISEPAEKLERGTEIRLHLKKDLGEFTDPARLKYILRKYSTFVPHPINVDGEHINDQPPIWVEPKSSVTEEQYQNFFEYLTHFPGQKAQWHLHLTADSPFQFHSILYCPDANLERMGFGKSDHGLHLCAKRILVQNDNRDLLPDYLRFLRGIVDSADLPLNVSREALQDNTVFRKMQKVITKKVLDHLDTIASDDSAAYGKFYGEFGSVLREGIGEDFDNRDRLAKLLRFKSTNTSAEDGLASLAGYCERAPEDQKQIYFATGADETSILRDPNLEIFRERNLEVLLLTDPVDEYVLSTLGEFDEHKLVPIDSADLELPGSEAKDSETDDEKKEDEKDAADLPNGFGTVLSIFKEALGDQVEDVRKSERLTESACCLVNAKGAQSTTMQKVLQVNMPDFEMSKMILEINPKAPLVQRLCELSVNDDNKDFVRTCGQQLYSNALIMAGLAPKADEMSSRVQDFMMQLAQQKSSIKV